MRSPLPFLIAIFVVSALIGILLFGAATKKKNEKLFSALLASLWILIPLFMAIGWWIDSHKVVIAGFLIPFGLFLLFCWMHQRIKYKKCSEPVVARFTSFAKTGRRGYYLYAPVFSYKYHHETFVQQNMTSYPKRKFQRLFQENNSYTIYINPDAPEQCVDKRANFLFFAANFSISMILLLAGIAVAVWM